MRRAKPARPRVAKLYATKLPDGMAAAFDEWLEQNNMKAYSFFQQAAERVVTVIPKIPVKRAPPPIPKKLPPPRLITELMLKVNRFIIEQVPRDDEVYQAIVREMMRSPVDLPCWSESTRKALVMVRDDLAAGKCFVCDYRGIVDAALEDWRNAQPKITMRKAAPSLPKKEEPEDDFAMKLVLGASEALGAAITELVSSPFEGGGGEFGGGGSSGEW
jgi:hypothetical protein